MPFQIIRDDIVRLKVDAIVNAANSYLLMGGGVCGAIFRAAGAEQLQQACYRVGPCPTGSAVITEGFALPARYVIHAVGPIWRGGSKGEEQQLYSCYTSSLRLAEEYGCKSIAFPLISSGIYGYPKDQALNVAVTAIRTFLAGQEVEPEVYLVVFDQASFQVSKSLVRKVTEFIDQNYVDKRRELRQERMIAENIFMPLPEELSGYKMPCAAPKPDKQPEPAENAELFQTAQLPDLSSRDDTMSFVMSRMEEGFSPRLLRLIDEKGQTDAQVYKRANITRQHFSKIRSNPGYQPKKTTVLAFAMALELDLEETQRLLETAGYALSHSSRADLIVEYFIRKQNYDIFELNQVLFAFEQQLLG